MQTHPGEDLGPVLPLLLLLGHLVGVELVDLLQVSGPGLHELRPPGQVLVHLLEQLLLHLHAATGKAQTLSGLPRSCTDEGGGPVGGWVRVP